MGQQAAATGRKRNEKLLQGLSALLSSLGEDDSDSLEDDELYGDLKQTVEERPADLLTALKRLITKHEQPQNQWHTVTGNRQRSWTDVVKNNVTTNGKGQSKGAIKGKGKGKEAQEHRSRQNPTYKGHKPNKGKGKGKPSQTWQPRPQDWEGNSKVVNNMEQYLQQEPKQAMLYKPNSAEDLEELYTEYEANNQDLPVTIIIDKYDLDMDDNPFHNKTWEDRRIRATIDGIVVSRMARTTQLGNTAPRFKPPKETAGRTGPVQQTTTIRIHIEQAYTQQWEAILTNPGRHFRAWAQDDLGQYIQDTWGWQLGPGCQGKNTRIQGLAKINGNKVKLALQLSGQTTDGIRCFTEPAKRDLDYPGSEPSFIGNKTLPEQDNNQQTME